MIVGNRSAVWNYYGDRGSSVATAPAPESEVAPEYESSQEDVSVDARSETDTPVPCTAETAAIELEKGAPPIHSEILLIIGPGREALLSPSKNGPNFIAQFEAAAANAGLKLRIIGNGKDPITHADIVNLKDEIPPFTPAIVWAHGQVTQTNNLDEHRLMVGPEHDLNSQVPTTDVLSSLRDIDNIGTISTFACKDGYSAKNIAADRRLISNPNHRYLCVGGKKNSMEVENALDILHTIEYYGECKSKGELPVSMRQQVQHHLLTSPQCIRGIYPVTQADGTPGAVTVHLPGLQTPDNRVHGRIDAAEVSPAEFQDAIKTSLHTVGDPEATPEYDTSALFQCIHRDNTHTVSSLMGKVDINKESMDGFTPLFFACAQGSSAMVQELLKHDDIDVNQVPTGAVGGLTPLWEACDSGDIDKVEALLSHPSIDVNKTCQGATPLYHACSTGNARAVGALLNHKDIAVNKTYRDASPFSAACAAGNVEVVKLLLSHGKIKLDIAEKMSIGAFMRQAEYSGQAGVKSELETAYRLFRERSKKDPGCVIS
jgi:hypothetical protein